MLLDLAQGGYLDLQCIEPVPMRGHSVTKRRVVVTGLGMLSPLGLNSEETWRRLLAGESGIGEITHFDSSNYSTRFAGQINDFDPLEYIEKKETKKML